MATEILVKSEEVLKNFSDVRNAQKHLLSKQQVGDSGRAPKL